MKTITIPTNHNPYTVVINNKEYTYKGGDTIEVPDEVAEAIEDALELEPKPKRYLNELSQLASGTLVELKASDMEGVEAIVYYALSYCRSLERVEMPSSVRKLEDGAFFGCVNLKTLRFGQNSAIESIGTHAFYSSKLLDVHLPHKPPVLSDVNAFASALPECVFYCPSQESLDAYKATQKWSTLAGTYAFVVEEK